MYMVYKGSILLHIDHFHSLVSCSEQQFPHFNSPEANLFHLINKNVFAINSHAGAEQDRQQSTTVSAESVATSVRTAQKSRKCSKCKKTGHTKRTCQGT